MKTKKEKLFAALNDFPIDDSKGFEKYLKSPLLNSNKKLIQLFDLRKYKNLTIESCYQHLYPTKKPNEQVVKNLISQLKTHYNRYLGIVTVLDNQQLFKSLALDQASKKNNLNRSWSPKFQPEHNYNLLHHSTKLFSFLHGDLMNDYETLREAGSSSLTLSKLLNYQNNIIDTSYYVKKCIVFIQYFAYLRKQPDAQVNNSLENSLSAFELSLTKQKGVVIELYKLALAFEKEQNIQAFQKLLKKFVNLDESTHSNHYNFIWTLLINYCIANLNVGIESFQTNAFELYEFYLKKNKTSSLKEITINNYVKLGVRVKKQNHVQQFLLENKKFFGTNTYNYCSALLKMHAGEYAESLSILQQVKFNNSYYKFNSKFLIIENFMNLNELDAAIYAIDSLTIYMKRSKNLTGSLKNYHLYLKYLQRIIKLRKKKLRISKQEFSESVKKLREEIKFDKVPIQKKILLKHLDYKW